MRTHPKILPGLTSQPSHSKLSPNSDNPVERYTKSQKGEGHMLTSQIVLTTFSPSTVIDRPRIHPGQVTNQKSIHEGDELTIHGRREYCEDVVVTQEPFNCGGCCSVKLLFKSDLREETVCLADLAVVRYQNGTWNIDNWIGRNKNSQIERKDQI